MHKRAMLRIGLWLAALVLVLDQTAKFFILEVLHFSPPGCLRFAANCGAIELSPVFDLRMVWNYGVSFGMLRAGGDLSRRERQIRDRPGETPDKKYSDQCRDQQDAERQAAVAPDVTPQLSADKMRERVKTLSADEFEGRGPGSPGSKKAADYIVGQMRAAGIKPGNGKSYF